tara:strand:- start:195 stop:566 length:372 start_codon:yes stop_codon:yes gene_type:complete
MFNKRFSIVILAILVFTVFYTSFVRDESFTGEQVLVPYQPLVGGGNCNFNYDVNWSNSSFTDCTNNVCTAFAGPGPIICDPVGSWCNTTIQWSNTSYAACINNTCTAFAGPGPILCNPVGCGC